MVIKNISLEEIQSRVERLTENATKHELEFIEILKASEIEFEFQWVVDAGPSYYIADFYLPKYNAIIEIDGYYHFTDEGRKKDKFRDGFLKFKKYKVIHIPNSKIYTFDFISALNNKNTYKLKKDAKPMSRKVKNRIDREFAHLNKIKNRNRKQEKLFSLYKIQYPFLLEKYDVNLHGTLSLKISEQKPISINETKIKKKPYKSRAKIKFDAIKERFGEKFSAITPAQLI